MLPPPITPIEEIIDTYHGNQIADPYRWLEDGKTERVRSWTAAQNAYSRAYLDALPGREFLREFVTGIARLGAVAPPAVRPDRLFYTRRTDLENQAVLVCRDRTSGTETILVDPNQNRSDGTVTLDWWVPSPDGTKVVFGLSSNGSEMSTLAVLEVATGTLLPDAIPFTRYASMAWLPDGSGFYYTRYPKPGSVPPGQEHYNRRLFFHQLGSDPETDPLVFGADRKPEEYLDAHLSPDGRFLLVTASRTFDIQDVYICDRTRNEGFFPLVENLDASFSGEIIGTTLYLRTNWQAPFYRVMAVDLERPREPWRELIPQGHCLLEASGVVGGKLVCRFLEQAHSKIRIFDLNGQFERELELPGLGTVSVMSGEWNDPDLFFSFTSFITPMMVRQENLASGESRLFAGIQAPALDASRYDIKQVRYPSKDGTWVTMFLVHRKGLQPDGTNPTILTGYGGFNISRTPEFLGSYLALLDAGFIYALPNLRGGGEYGESWHEAGMKQRKQNVFDDFISAAEHLIQTGYTTPEKLAINGGSNGGLLVGAVLTQRPDLFRAVVCQVPLLDMLRYHLFLIARTWIPEYGCADEPADFSWLRAYSPYHQVKPGTVYPAVLLMTAESDTRVDPLHARKMAALLQAAQVGPHPILLRLEAQAGHGVGKPTAKRIEEAVDFLSFICAELNQGLRTED
ncbi:MAG: prolyl oligopeptidase family serine peptidase [Blastocatellia bacterium]|nr:prolyl oligopeptidase family serine peptidase [Blastocatellia bacterium]